MTSSLFVFLLILSGQCSNKLAFYEHIQENPELDEGCGGSQAMRRKQKMFLKQFHIGMAKHKQP